MNDYFKENNYKKILEKLGWSCTKIDKGDHYRFLALKGRTRIEMVETKDMYDYCDIRSEELDNMAWAKIFDGVEEYYNV